jgi:hypothetical protein
MFEVCQAKGSSDIEWTVYQYVQFNPGPFDLNIDRIQTTILYMYVSVYEVLSLSSKAFSRYWADKIFLFPVLIDLDL